MKAAVRKNTEFLNNWNGFKVINKLEFPLEWGLGSSSTLINNVANWAEINPFLLHFDIASGSGYDIACAEADGPIIYQLKDDELHFEEVDFDPNFLDQVFFVHLGNKQNTKSAISHYSKTVKKRRELADRVGQITDEVLACQSIDRFIDLIEEHENLLSTELSLKRLKDERFSDFNGTIKSLGAWGGDFAMVVSRSSIDADMAYFKSKGLKTMIPYHEMIYSTSIKKPA